MGITRLETARSYVDARLFCTAHVLGTVPIHNQQAHATLPCTCPWHSAHPYSADTRSFARHTPSVDVTHTLRRRSLKLPHDQRPACKTHANSISTGSPMQLRTNRRGRSPAPSSVNPVKLRTNHRPHAPAPSSMNHVKLRTKRRLSCLSPWSSGNPVHLRITRVGQATCHQCEEIRRVVTASGLVGPFERYENIVPANIEQTKKGSFL